MSSSQTIGCELCPHYCKIKPGGNGLCKVRFNRNGQFDLPFYGFITALGLDPIEKKPLYHFRPGSQILSVGFVGCNMHCPFCQNWHISQNTESPGRNISAIDLVENAKKNTAIAYTYSEPLVHIEFLLDCMTQARKSGVANVLVTNGCVNKEAANEILGFAEAVNVDLKCFNEETYSKTLGGNLKTVLAFIESAYAKGVHVELTTLVVPGLNDSKAELDKCRDFISALETPQNPIPWHLSAYHPDWKWKAPSTTPELLTRIANGCHGRPAYVYTGNIAGEKNDTACVSCGNILVSRRAYRINVPGLNQKTENNKETYYCSSCGKAAPFRV